MSIFDQLGHLQNHTSRAVNLGGAAVNTFAGIDALVKHHDLKQAGKYLGTAVEDVSIEAAQHRQVWEVATLVAEKFGVRGAMLVGRSVGEKVPIVGAVVGFGFGAVEVGTEAWKMAQHPPQSNWKKLASATTSAVAQTAGGMVGFGAGEALQEGAHWATSAAFGKENAASHAATVELAILAVSVTQDVIADNAKPAAPLQPDEINAQAALAAKALSGHQVLADASGPSLRLPASLTATSQAIKGSVMGA